MRAAAEIDYEGMSSYAVLWSEPLGDVETGKLELGRECIRFEGSHCGREGCVHCVCYEDIEGVRIGYGARERLQGRPALVVDLLDGGPVRIGSVNGVGTVAELADALTRLAGRVGRAGYFVAAAT